MNGSEAFFSCGFVVALCAIAGALCAVSRSINNVARALFYRKSEILSEKNCQHKWKEVKLGEGGSRMVCLNCGWMPLDDDKYRGDGQ